MTARFGPSGSPQSFLDAGYRSTLQMPDYLAGLGLDAFEYQCGHGVNIKEDSARLLGEKAREKGIALSLHAPYYISLASAEPEKRDRSIDYILSAARAASWMGADRVILHPGGAGKMPREQAMALAADTFRRALAALDEAGLGEIALCPETMGKLKQLGDLEEVLALCALDERVIPCLDLGHLNARTRGGFTREEDFVSLLDRLANVLGRERAGAFHAHFSKIEYGPSGEIRHLTFADDRFGPEPAPFLRAVLRRGAAPRVLCESAGTQAIDALTMQTLYREGVNTI